jgi:putative ABC transport system permease protein
MARVVEGVLYEVSPTEPLTVVVVAVFLAVVAVVATLFPALEAARVNPVESLRDG